jgi:hypothetical protein
MSIRRLLLFTALALVAFGCTKQETASSATTSSETVASSTQPAPAPAPAAAQPAPAASAAPAGSATPAAAPPPAGALATQETNWSGVSADVTEFRRKGNTLTAKVRLTNRGSAEAKVEVIYKDVYLIDTNGGKKYEVLKDEKGVYIGDLRSGWNDRWYGDLAPGASHLVWMKFPAPPAEVKTITLQVPGVQPFEDLTIQD